MIYDGVWASPGALFHVKTSAERAKVLLLLIDNAEKKAKRS